LPRTLSLEGSSRLCRRGDGRWDARAVRATGRASRHPGRERGTVMKSSISWSAFWFITTRKRTPTRSSPEHPGRWRREPARLAGLTRADNRRCCLPLEQPEVAHRGVPALADHHMVVQRDAELAGDLGDLAGHRDVVGGGRRIAGRV